MDHNESNDSSRVSLEPLTSDLQPATIHAVPVAPEIYGVPSSKSSDSPDELLPFVQEIIRTRKQSALISTAIIVFGASVILFFHADVSVAIVAPIAAVILAMSLLHYTLNSLNYPAPHRWYRAINRIFYTDLVRLGIVINMFMIIVNAIRFFNPMYGFKEPGLPSRTELLVNSAVSGVGAYGLYASLPPAKLVETYYQKLEAKDKTILAGDASLHI